jgi:hypothetical protein
MYQTPKPKGKERPIAIIALICGVLGASGIIVEAWGLLGALGVSVMAIVFGASARKTAASLGEKTEMGTMGWILGIVFTVWNTIKIIFWLLVLFTFLSVLRSCGGGYY